MTAWGCEAWLLLGNTFVICSESGCEKGYKRSRFAQDSRFYRLSCAPYLACYTDATDVLITGDSAGGVAALNAAGPLRAMLQPRMPWQATLLLLTPTPLPPALTVTRILTLNRALSIHRSSVGRDWCMSTCRCSRFNRN